ncbi:hypothetical protein HYH03_012718 [Edaphochlamys debaryana]|uniref:Tubulin-tyrosine ligase n=1 Tax=Edaphochlamys debaryana TaxID=47281 RepID=A0A835XR50_9CHLO|nr:hypothetical protein HYH03_012718 [Edaphochlamys debaryana]|eukprot:KAG2488718.1 hypothetical protein HYH03_012718 [Edaphochlamys debaryana]
MAACPPGTVWFYKKAKASRGRGVFPITSLDQLPPEELAEAEAAVAASAAAAAATDDGAASVPAATVAAASGGGVFQQAVPNMLLWEGGRKFDLRVLVVMGPGRRAWLHRTLYMRVATEPLTPGDLGRASQCTNISQGGTVLAVHGSAELSGYDTVLSGLLDAVRTVVSAMYDVLPAEGAIHYFGFDFMLDAQLKPWLLEVNSTPRLVNCNRTGAVHAALVELLAGIVEPCLDGRPLGATGGWLPVHP